MAVIKAVNGYISVLSSGCGNRPGEVFVNPDCRETAYNGVGGALYFIPEEARWLARILLAEADKADKASVAEPMGSDW